MVACLASVRASSKQTSKQELNRMVSPREQPRGGQSKDASVGALAWSLKVFKSGRRPVCSGGVSRIILKLRRSEVPVILMFRPINIMKYLCALLSHWGMASR